MPTTTVHAPAGRPPSTALARDLPIDALRAAAVGVVVVGHAIVAAVGWREGRLVADNLLATSAMARVLTWVFQVLPLVFVCGGVAAAHSARRSGWLAGRVERLVAPVSAYLAIVSGGLAGAWAAGLLDRSSAEVIGRALAMHLWFLAAFVLVTAMVPLLLGLAGRLGWRAVPGALLAAGLVDVASAWWSAVAWLNVAVVWGLCTFIGVLRASGHRWPGGRCGAGLSALVTLTGLVALVRFGGYPVSMVGVPGAGRSNAGPPSLAMALLALTQAGAFTALHDHRWRPRRPAAIAAANRMVMGAYLWQFAGVVLAAVLLLPTGVLPSPATGSGAWWAWRPAWVAACLLAVGAVLAIVGVRATGRPAPGRPGSLGTAVAVVAAVAGFVLVTTSGITASLGFAAGAACLLVARLVARSGTSTPADSHAASLADSPTADPGDRGRHVRSSWRMAVAPRRLVARTCSGEDAGCARVDPVRSSASAQTTPAPVPHAASVQPGRSSSTGELPSKDAQLFALASAPCTRCRSCPQSSDGATGVWSPTAGFFACGDGPAADRW